MNCTSVYLVLGALGAGRRSAVVDLLEGGLFSGTSVSIYCPEHEKSFPTLDEDVQIDLNLHSWKWQEGQIIASEPVEGATAIFFILSGTESPVDALEKMPEWLKKNELMLTRIITVLDCKQAQNQADWKPWYEACIHFSDVVLLRHEQGHVAHSWLEPFLEHYSKSYYPCLWLRIKQEGLENPALVLDSSVRRMSHAFDEPLDSSHFEGEEGNNVEEDRSAESEDLEPYFVRLPNGQRAKPLMSLNIGEA